MIQLEANLIIARYFTTQTIKIYSFNSSTRNKWSSYSDTVAEIKMAQCRRIFSGHLMKDQFES